MERIEATVLRNLVFDEDYSRKVIPFIQPDYFEQKTDLVTTTNKKTNRFGPYDHGDHSGHGQLRLPTLAYPFI